MAKGQSGNPNGRPKKQAPPPDDFLTTLIAAANEIVDVNPPGQPAQIKAVQLLARQMMMQALKSKGLDQVRLVNFFERLGLFAALSQQSEEAAKEKGGGCVLLDRRDRTALPRA
ncbi:DUF5681 domain-containing protein [Novosphingobium sp. Chol11]|jgi:hypothetical protein|uniref:DUF5681 domain-containing protein n=1 Tax=Novosphingobium sp. Chol11 TaxID=1385763 RepID=UPI000BE43495|nr:DUF5681 domain-containing protein [Novosphingobium sp. Chol11]